jgi:cysteine desulfuration protein SufE
MTAITEIVENFELLDEWDDRYRYVIELGRTLSPLPDSAHIDANKVQGCASRVCAHPCQAKRSSGPVLSFEGDSDAHIVRGLIAILFALYSGKSAREILTTDALALFDSIGLREISAAALEWFAVRWWSRSAPRRRPPWLPACQALSTPKAASSASQVLTGARQDRVRAE